MFRTFLGIRPIVVSSELSVFLKYSDYWILTLWYENCNYTLNIILPVLAGLNIIIYLPASAM